MSQFVVCSGLDSQLKLIGHIKVVRERILQVYIYYIVQCVYIAVLYPQFFSKFSLLMLFNVGMQVILIFLLVILALRLPMLHCLHAFLFTPVVRKLHFLVCYNSVDI